ncbi:hypothetical protein M501DRAFT_32254 [Patellaria atrata CBS 101060]|uniref:1-phosphatidylinositol 4-kinase n=1 Tax=Patellaria atrata CBS 101060 TaxID=1346257 RepID=A0A9P4SJA1_9PEZI|nr:hypothetical protein M501DRAFT_32254 [Patellaria atrata CBS 101060]
MKSLRREALQKLAELSATSSTSQKGGSDLTKLCKLCPGASVAPNGIDTAPASSKHGIFKVPMQLGELEVIFALCKASHLVQDIKSAEQLLRQLSPYLPESHSQVVSQSPTLRVIDPSPWEALTYNLSSALLNLGLTHSSLRPRVVSAIETYIDGWAHIAGAIARDQFDDSGGEISQEEEHNLAQIIRLVTSLLGFLDAAAENARFWTSSERLELVERLQRELSERFMVTLETALSLIRNARPHYKSLKYWKKFCKHYAGLGRPLGAMLLQQAYMQLVSSFASLTVAPADILSKTSVLDHLQSNPQSNSSESDFTDEGLIQGLAGISADIMQLLEDGSDYLQLGSSWQQRLASAVKSNAIVTFLCCTVSDKEVAEPSLLLSWLETTAADPVQMGDEGLASTVLKAMAILAKTSPTTATRLSRSLPRIIVQGGLESRTASVAADSLGSILKLLPQDAVITTLYSLGNILSSGKIPDRTVINSLYLNGSSNHRASPTIYNQQTTGSAISLAPSDAEEPSNVYAIVIKAIAGIAASCQDEKLTALALSMLVQKIGKVILAVDAQIIKDTALLGIHSGLNEFRSLLKLYSKICQDALMQKNALVLEAVMSARTLLSKEIKRGSPLYEVYMVHLLDSIISKGDAHQGQNTKLSDVELAAHEIAQLLSPLAILVAENRPQVDRDDINEHLVIMQRDSWFNVVVHGFHLSSPLGRKYSQELEILAQFSRPLITEDRVDQMDSDIELNTTLRRGKGGEHAVEQKKHLIEALPSCESDIRSLSYSETVFLNAAYLVETLRARSGICTKSLVYFHDQKLRTGAMGNCMSAIAMSAVQTYLSRTITGTVRTFSAPYVARQLATLFTGCCHRISKIQQVATSCADLIIQQVPSALCQRSSLFALLELLTIMWASCLEQDTDEYEWKSTYKSSREPISIELSDDYAFRRATLLQLQARAKTWVLNVLNIAPLDIKGLLQTYLSEYTDDGVYGHVALGRSFAIELGSVIPSTDQRLGAIEVEKGVHINTASDFIAQYTSRQEYRFVEGFADHDEEWLCIGGPNSRRGSAHLKQSSEDAATVLAEVESRTLSRKQVSIAELRDALRRSAALLCRVKKDQCAIAHHLVGIPFAVFTKQSIKLGISLWMSVIKENPRMESRILVAITENWVDTVRKRRGFFNPAFKHEDPLYGKMEFAPSDRAVIAKQQQRAYNTIAPHFRLIQFLESHYNASRLGIPSIEKIYHRLMQITLDHMVSTTSHPLAREVHFHIILLGLKMLRFNTSLDGTAQWRFKDRLLGAALAWFSLPPRWSFGGNRLQIKAETHVLADVQMLLEKTAHIGSKSEASLKSLQGKQDLLQMLLSSEQTRLMVWLFPLDYEKKHYFASGHQTRAPPDAALSAVLKTAWAENPTLAVQLANRFQSANLKREVRWLVLNFPEKVLHIPDALEVLLGPSLPNDVSFQLKYLLYWAPINPPTSATYFLPAYGNHPFIIQYAMRSLESHSVDVTFFYVPQIVQTLRYDVLGYVERYIIETGKFSQLFAHQIIWNMKANAYKDEDSQVPDSVKPTLDKVMDSLVTSFSDKDRGFYEREFAFFNEVTDVSGKLRPYIKKSKPEKKQKIEEELRKIKVEVGVYLPSNPDGVVVGIDRKSGKPLQSHAKAPYMATFRIRKDKSITSGTEQAPADDNSNSNSSEHSDKDSNTYEVWQSAIFKVGDDCRQDVLALQMISAFRGIFNSVGLDVYVFPYRVTATAPGCGVIDVLPNAISRDMLGREAVNGLYDYFVSKYGGEDSVRFQEARSNFVKSMAAYSVVSYLLQFKDRHNGNIMIGEAGHILHIDFGFCFDIAPGGVRFERAPFKLTSEMVAVMGGSTNSQSYKWFEELCVKAFLAVRQHSEHLAHIVILMLDSGLPCFKPETIQHFRERFVLERSEREAADFMRELIKRSQGSYSTRGYDQFQLLTNGIPY